MPDPPVLGCVARPGCAEVSPAAVLALERVRLLAERRLRLELAYRGSLSVARGLGCSLAEVALAAGVSRQAVHQLTSRASPVRAQEPFSGPGSAQERSE